MEKTTSRFATKRDAPWEHVSDKTPPRRHHSQTALERGDGLAFRLERRVQSPDSSARYRASRASLVSKSTVCGDVLPGPRVPRLKASPLLLLCSQQQATSVVLSCLHA